MSILLAHVMPWFGDGNLHRMQSYVSNDPAVIDRQITILQGTKIANEIIRGVIMTWQGPGAAFQHQTVTEWCTQCEARRMLFCLLMDPWIAKIGSPGNATVDIQNVINALNAPSSQTMLNSPAYLPEKYVLDFNTGVSLASLASTFPTLQFLQMDVGFSWPSIPGQTDSMARNAASVASMQSRNQNPAMKIPGFLMRFNDSGQPTPVGVSAGAWTGTRNYNVGVWGNVPNRVLDDQGGKLFLDMWGVAQTGAVVSAVPYYAIVTWNDYDEQTVIEPYAAAAMGIRIGS